MCYERALNIQVLHTNTNKYTVAAGRGIKLPIYRFFLTVHFLYAHSIYTVGVRVFYHFSFFLSIFYKEFLPESSTIF